METNVLLGTLVGAAAVLIPQIFMYVLNSNKEKKQRIIDLIGEERRLAYLLEEYYKELVMYKTHKEYWYKASTLIEYDEETKKENHRRHLEKNQKSFETLDKIRVAKAEYFKVLTLFLKVKGENLAIRQIMRDIKKFKPSKASNYEGIENANKLYEAQDIDEDKLNNEYAFYGKNFSEIYKEMIK